MLFEPRHIKFENRKNPKASFDLVFLDQLFWQRTLDHNLEQFHIVEFYNLLFITEGKGKHTIDFTDYTYQKGTILTIRKDQLIKFFKNREVQGYMLLFKEDFIFSYLEQLEAIKTLQLFNEQLGSPKIQLTDQSFPSIKNLVDEIQKEYLSVNDEYSLGIIRSKLHVLITQLFRIKSRSKAIVSDKKYLPEFIAFQKLVEANCTSIKKVKDYARMMGLSTKTLNNISQSIVHKTAKAFIDDIKLTQIKRLLINTEFSIKEIAFDSGFEESTNFYKFFKRAIGSTPEQFRESKK